MKRFTILLICCLIVFGISSQGALGLSPRKSKVFKPDQLLSEAEAAKLVGIPEISLDKNSLKVSPETGASNTYYVYDIQYGSTLHALFYLVQNGAMAKANMASGAAAKTYNSYYAEAKNESEILSGIGDKAFFFKPQQHLFVLYGNYFFMVAFKSFDEEESKGRAINIAIARQIVENIKKK